MSNELSPLTEKVKEVFGTLQLAGNSRNTTFCFLWVGFDVVIVGLVRRDLGFNGGDQ